MGRHHLLFGQQSPTGVCVTGNGEVRSGDFNRNEITRIRKLVEENQEVLLRGWNEYFTD